MKGYDIIHELYHGNLRPCDQGFRADTTFSIAMEAFTEHERWLRERLAEEAGKRFNELMSCHQEIVNMISYENFRLGFQLGAMIIMEVIGGNTSVTYDL